MDYTIIYSSRKTLSLQINKSGEVIVRAPKRVEKVYIEKLIESKKEWVAKHQAFLRETTKAPKMFIEDALFLYLGKEYPLRILEGYRRKVEFRDAFYISKFFITKAPLLLEQWYKEQAKVIFQERADYYAQTMGVTFKRIAIRAASTRWGSCSSLGNINFTWRLIMAPLGIIDYVVIHELAHIRHKNHSAGFWEFVERQYPDFKYARKWLRVHGATLMI